MYQFKLYFTVFIFYIFLLAGCSGPMDTKLDGTSIAAYQKGLQKIHDNITTEQKEQLTSALEILKLPDIGNVILFLAMLSPEKVQLVLARIDGKTPNQIIAEAKKVREEELKSQLAKTEERIVALNIRIAEEKKIEEEKLKSQFAAVEEKITNLQKIKDKQPEYQKLIDGVFISDPKFYFSKNYFSQDPVIDFKITNNTTIPLAAVYFHGTLTSPGRSIPWVDEDFNYEFKGGLEPNESQHLKLSPNRFSRWGNHELANKDDLVLSVAVVNAAGADLKKIVVPFSSADQSNLDKLTELLGQLKTSISEIEISFENRDQKELTILMEVLDLIKTSIHEIELSFGSSEQKERDKLINEKENAARFIW